MKQMNSKEQNEASSEALKNLRVEELKEAAEKAQEIARQARVAYLEARDAYHKVYREIWRS